MKKYHVFDFDGTLADSMKYWSSAMTNVLDEEGIKYPDDLINILTPLGYEKSAVYLKDLGVKYSVEEILKKFYEFAVNAYTNDVQMKPFVKEYLTSLKEKGCSLYVLTASPHATVDPCLKRCGLYDVFDKVWSTDDFSLRKSDPTIYFKAAEIIGAEIDDIVFYDDNFLALSTAASTGISCVGVHDDTSRDDREKIMNTVDVFVDSFEELL